MCSAVVRTSTYLRNLHLGAQLSRLCAGRRHLRGQLLGLLLCGSGRLLSSRQMLGAAFNLACRCSNAKKSNEAYTPLHMVSRRQTHRPTKALCGQYV